MKKSDWKDIAELIGIAAIVASLIFVGVELRQTRQIAIADIYQQQSDSLIDLQIGIAEPARRELYRKLGAGEILTDQEQRLFAGRYVPWITYYENNHFQYQIGLLTEEHWQAILNSLRRYYASDDQFRDWWSENRTDWRESFVQVIDGILEEELMD